MSRTGVRLGGGQRVGTAAGPTTRNVPAGLNRRPMQVGEEGFLWILVGIEVATIALLRRKFRGRHGG